MLAIYFLAFLHVTIENETFHVSFTPPPHRIVTLSYAAFSWSIVLLVLY